MNRADFIATTAARILAGLSATHPNADPGDKWRAAYAVKNAIALANELRLNKIGRAEADLVDFKRAVRAALGSSENLPTLEIAQRLRAEWTRYREALEWLADDGSYDAIEGGGYVEHLALARAALLGIDPASYDAVNKAWKERGR